MTDDASGLSDGVVTIRPPSAADIAHLVAGRDSESERWFGTTDHPPSPTACVLVRDEVVGWVDYDTDQEWLGPREVNLGYSIFEPHRRNGYAVRAVNLFLSYLEEATDASRAYLAIDAENVASLGVARALGADETEQYRNDEGRLQIKFMLPVGIRI